MTSSAFPIHPRQFLVLFGLFLFAFWGFNRPEPLNETSNEYLTMVVRFEQNSQMIEISKRDEKPDLYYYHSVLLNQRQINRLRPWKTEQVGFRSLFDHRYILNHIHSLEEEGWKLVSHNFSGSQSSSVSEIDARRTEAERVSFYLFKK